MDDFLGKIFYGWKNVFGFDLLCDVLYDVWFIVDEEKIFLE